MRAKKRRGECAFPEEVTKRERKKENFAAIFPPKQSQLKRKERTVSCALARPATSARTTNAKVSAFVLMVLSSLKD